ncbi:ankyrin repeat-containing domain protein [Hypoxylon rubiginosum]|uniref:Ankyrin repeat-containing domain protein n=1 Tax=Hypoxylon rubiginosum TaxID=110542 RepID=A0ACC0CYN1_9PEZI|nr:ankyrin repeat-containing domain protein [Hypoxylon rubiginosum]
MIVAYHANDYEKTSDLASLAQVTRRLHTIVNPILYNLTWVGEVPRAVAFAIKKPWIETLEVIISLGFDLNKSDHLLCVASESGNLEIVAWMLDHGMPINPESSKPETSALLCAIRSKHESVALLLLARGADPHIIPSKMHEPTYLRAAVKSRMMEVMEVLVREKGLPVDEQASMDSLLIITIRHGDEDTVKKLIELGADINDHTRGGLPLVEALRLGKFKHATILLDAGATFRPRHWEKREPYPIHAAKWLADDNDPYNYDRTRRLNQCAVLSKLVEAGVDLEERYENGYTLLEEALINGSLEVVSHLLDIGASCNSKNSNRRTPMDVLVASYKIIECKAKTGKMVMLLRAGERMDVPLANGVSLLQWSFDRMFEIHNQKLPLRLLEVATHAMLRDDHLDELLHKYARSRQYEACLIIMRFGGTLKDRDLVYTAAETIIRKRRWYEESFNEGAFFRALLEMGLGLPKPKLAELFSYAMKQECTDHIDTLLSRGVLDLLHQNPEWLHLAVERKERYIMRRMLSCSVDINHLRGSETPLVTALRHGKFDAAWILLNCGADPLLPRNDTLKSKSEETNYMSAFEVAVRECDDLSLVKKMWSKAAPESRPILSAIIPHVPSKHNRVVEWLKFQAKAQGERGK